ncbi:MAG: metallophosphoesterase [Clostridiales bacterium]|nr:metallophosphoesterase [Clostridiales bacterium]
MIFEDIPKITAAGVTLAAVSAVSYIASKRWLAIRRERAAFDWMPERLDGLKILHISDLHGNSTEKMNLDIWSAIESLDFDMAVITGDLVVGEMEQITPHLPSIKRLARRTPVFYVEGNHEMMFFEEISALLREVGVTVLANERQTWKIGKHGPVSIVGLRDYGVLQLNRMRDSQKLLNACDGGFHLILSHQPQIFKYMKRLKLGLALSGHTHGGQVRLPGFPTLYAPGQGILPKYGDGWYSEGYNKLYVSRGVGVTLFPARLFNRPEIAVIECAREAE